jgi:hypothetical protein
MIDKKIIELIHKEIDGVITPEEKIRLHDYLSQNPRAQQMFEEQVCAAELLHQIPSIDPPEDLKKRIMNTIDLNRYTAVRTKIPSWRLSRGWSFRINPKLAFSLGLGFILGIVVFAMLLNVSKDDFRMRSKDFMGTIGLHGRSRFQQVDKAIITLPDIQGRLTLLQADDYIGLDVRLHSRDFFELLVRWPADRMEFQGFQPSDKIKTTFENGDDYIKTSNATEAQHVLYLRRTTSESAFIDVTLLQHGVVQHYQRIHVKPEQPLDEESR